MPSPDTPAPWGTMRPGGGERASPMTKARAMRGPLWRGAGLGREAAAQWADCPEGAKRPGRGRRNERRARQRLTATIEAAGRHCPPAGVQGQSPWGEILCGDMCGAKARFARSEAQGKADPCLRPPAKSADFEAESPFTGGQSHPVNASKGAGF